MTARALVVEHTATAGAGWLGDWLPAAGLALDLVRPYAGERLPSLLDSQALVVLGGPMGANDDQAVPWLPGTRALLQRAVERSVPVLGVCLGGQLLAVACGGRVERGSSGPELGVETVRLLPAAAQDPLLLDLPPRAAAVQWHYDAVTELPAGATSLADSVAYPHQAFRVGDRAWGLQFHLEATPETVAGWARSDAAAVRAAGLHPDQVVRDITAAEPALTRSWRLVAERFAALAGQ